MACVHCLSFCPDGRWIYCTSKLEHIVWNVPTGEIDKQRPWPDQLSEFPYSPDGRWLVVPSGKCVLLVDQNYRHTSYELAFRESNARIDSLWHRAQAEVAAANENWYAESFHRAWTIKADSRDPDDLGLFNIAYMRLSEEFREVDKDLVPSLHPVVVEILDGLE